MNYTNRQVEASDLYVICNFPKNADELFFMFPKANYPLTSHQLKVSIDNRFNSTVVLIENTVAGFANFHEVEKNNYCAIGNLIVNPLFRGMGVGSYLVNIMEVKAKEQYFAKKIHISCFSNNVEGLLLYKKLAYIPFDIEKRIYNDLPIALIKMIKKI